MRTFLFFAIIGWCAVCPLSAETFELKFTRPFEAGSQFSYKADGKRKTAMKVTMNGQELQNESDSAAGSFASHLTILEVNEAGLPTKEEHEITAFSGTVDEAAVETPAVGTKIVATRSAEQGTTYTIDDKAVDPKLQALLETLISVSSEENQDDAILGTDQPRAIGDEWEVGAEELIASMKESGMPLDAASVVGKGTLVGKVSSPVGEALEVRAEIQIKLDDAGGPMPVKLSEASMTVTMSGLLPIDPKAQAPKKEMALRMVMKGEGEPQPGAKLSMDMAMEQQASVEMVPMK